MSSDERIFEHPARIRDARSADIIGHCVIGRSFSSMFDELADRKSAGSRTLDIPIDGLFKLLKREAYVLWYAEGSNHRSIRITVALKEGHTPIDHLKAWAHAVELAKMCSNHDAQGGRSDNDEKLSLISHAYHAVEDVFQEFVEQLRSIGWGIDEGVIVVGLPPTIVVNEDVKK